MHFEDLLKEFPVDRFPKAAELLHPEKSAVLNAREMATIAIKNDDFICDCISLEIDRLGLNKFSTGLSPFYTLPDTGIRFSLGYWSPGSGADAHEHTAWTITGVYSNKLEVTTYDREASYKTNSLIPKNHFEGLSGSTGFIYGPCIHAPKNTSKNWSLTFHASSPLDGLRPDDYPEPLSCLVDDYTIGPELSSHPYFKVITARQKSQFADQLAIKLLTINTKRSRSLLAKCLDLCSTRIRNELRPHLYNYAVKDFSPGFFLEIADPKLKLECSCGKNIAVLNVVTPKATVQVLSANIVAREAIIYAITERSFDVGKLPGDLTKREQHALAEALEETGLFKRISN